MLHSDEWEAPVPLSGPVNTAGVEDSPFISPEGDDLYFYFTPDANEPGEVQLMDGVSGIWYSQKINGEWSEPERIVLHDDLSLDGAEFVSGDTMWFGSIREGNYGEIDFYIAAYTSGKWTDIINAGALLNSEYDVGELHITADGNTMYCGKIGEKWDIWELSREGDAWSEPVKVESINSVNDENQPFVTLNGNELWFTGDSRNGYTGPAVFRSLKTESGWGEPEEIISNFAGEPTLDEAGNIYFVHVYIDKSMQKIETDIFVAIKK